MYDRNAILRKAHATARRAMATSRSFRSYRQAFAQALRFEWCQAKRAKAQAEVEAEEAELRGFTMHLPEAVVAGEGVRLVGGGLTKRVAMRDNVRRQRDRVEEAALAAIQLSQRGGFHLVAR